MDDQDLDLLEKEMKVMKAIDHPNIVRYEDSFTIKRCFGFKTEMSIIIELCENGNLFD